jgi:hypothetical protein
MVEGLQDKGGLDPTDDDDQGDQDDEGKNDDEHDDLDDFQDSMETDKKDSSGNKQLSSKRSHQSVGSKTVQINVQLSEENRPAV